MNRQQNKKNFERKKRLKASKRKRDTKKNKHIAKIASTQDDAHTHHPFSLQLYFKAMLVWLIQLLLGKRISEETQPTESILKELPQYHDDTRKTGTPQYKLDVTAKSDERDVITIPSDTRKATLRSRPEARELATIWREKNSSMEKLGETASQHNDAEMITTSSRSHKRRKKGDTATVSVNADTKQTSKYSINSKKKQGVSKPTKIDSLTQVNKYYVLTQIYDQELKNTREQSIDCYKDVAGVLPAIPSDKKDIKDKPTHSVKKQFSRIREMTTQPDPANQPSKLFDDNRTNDISTKLDMANTTQSGKGKTKNTRARSNKRKKKNSSAKSDTADINNSLAHFVNKSMINFPVQSTGTETKNSPAHSNEIGTKMSPVYFDEIKMFNSPAHLNGTEKMSPPHLDETDTSLSPIHETQIKTSPAHSRGTEIKVSPVHIDKAEMENCPGQSDKNEPLGSPTLTDGVKTKSSSSQTLQQATSAHLIQSHIQSIENDPSQSDEKEMKDATTQRHNMREMQQVFASERELKEKINILEKKVEEMEVKLEMVLSLQNLSCVPPVPPPPPPPPPPPAPPVPLLWKKRVKSAKKVKKTDNEPLITLDAIKSVKLKKREIFADKENQEKDCNGRPKISLRAITAVKLKPKGETVDTLKTPMKSLLLTRALRKTGIDRSPGGTPIAPHGKTVSTGVGLTPEIARALKKKFRSVRCSPLCEQNSFEAN